MSPIADRLIALAIDARRRQLDHAGVFLEMA
jgi:hypothetical protein